MQDTKQIIDIVEDRRLNSLQAYFKRYTEEARSRALNKTRIPLMKNFKKHSRKFKRYWRLFLKSHTLLNTTTYRTVYGFKQPMREIDILNFLLDLSPELKVTYDLYQDLLFAIQTINIYLKQNIRLFLLNFKQLFKPLKRIKLISKTH